MSHSYRWMREHGTLHIPDVRAQNDFPTLGSAGGWRTFLAVPLRQQGELIGVLVARRIEVRPFTPAQIKLLETFADQAVIAIENVRLFQELEARTRELAQSVGELESVGRGRSGGQLYPRPPDCAQHHRAPCGPALTNRWWCRLRIR